MSGDEELLESASAQATARAAWLRIETLARDDDRVVGLVLLGGRGKGIVRDWSDYDVDLITRDGFDAEVQREVGAVVPGVELDVASLTDYGQRATPWWDRYAFKGVRPVVDKLRGGVAEVVARRAAYEPELATRHAREWLSTYVNQLYRALKNLRDGLVLESQLDGSAGLDPMVGAMFAMQGRLRPYNKFLAWELEHDPLAHLPWSAGEFLALLSAAVRQENPDAHVQLFRGVDSIAIECGFGDHLRDEWGATIDWILGYR